MPLILASTSSIRRQLLKSAGVEHVAIPPGVDEEPYKRVHERPEQLAIALAEAKARAVSEEHRKDWVIGSDSVVMVQGVGRCGKPRDRSDAAAQLRLFSDRRMHLTSAVALARKGKVDWHNCDQTVLKVRELSERFIESYLNAEWPEVGYTAGVFRLEAMGAQLFSWIHGDYFTILGMPLLQLLDALRKRGLIET